MRRRVFLVLPLLSVPCIGGSDRDRHDVTEIRYGAPGADTDLRARALARYLGIAVRGVRLSPVPLAQALNAGQLELASLEGGSLRLAFRMMGDRLVSTPFGAVRRALPTGLHGQLVRALAATASLSA